MNERMNEWSYTHIPSTFPSPDNCRDIVPKDLPLSSAFIHYGSFNLLNTKSNPICYLLALLGAHYILHVSGIWVK